MTYTEKRNQLLTNIKKQVADGTFIRSFCPTEGLRDFMFCEDIDGVKTVFHKQEIFATDGRIERAVDLFLHDFNVASVTQRNPADAATGDGVGLGGK